MKDLAASVRARLLAWSKERGIQFQYASMLYMQEGILSRLAASPFVDKLILKGGFLIFTYAGSSGRTTKDIDFLGQGIPNDETALSGMGGFTFNAGAGAFMISGNAITLAGDITNHGTSLQTINLAMATTVVRTVTTATGGGNVTLGGIISGSGGGLAKSGGGMLTLNGLNTYTGPTTVTAGTLSIGPSAGLYSSGATAGAVDVKNGATMLFNRSDVFGNAYSNAPVVVAVEAGGTLQNGSGTVTALNHAVLNGGTISAGTGYKALLLAGHLFCSAR